MTLEAFDSWFKSRYKRTTSALIATMMVISDFIAVMISFGAGFLVVKLYYIMIDDWGGIDFKSFVTYWPYLPFFIMTFFIVKLYPGVAQAPAEEIKSFTIASIFVHGGIIVSRYIQYDRVDSYLVAFTFSFAFSITILMICRDIMHFFIRKVRMRGIPAVIYGSGSTSRLIVDRLLGAKKVGYEPVLILDQCHSNGDFYRDIPIIPDMNLGPDLVNRYNIKMAIIAAPNLESKEMINMITKSASAFRYNVLIPDFFNVNNIWMSVRDFDGVLGFASTHRLKMFWNLAIKRFLDLLLVLIGGIIIFPFLLIIALLIKLSSPGPVLYGHKRLGLNGRYFKAYKFRTMVKDADKKLSDLLASNAELQKEWNETYKLKNDPRITKIGKFLRRLSFDEFPQLLNILKGEMSIVGPRPVVDGEIDKYGENALRILTVKPGLTGIWQVSGRSDTDYGERISYDLYYLQSWSVWLDLWIIYRTPSVIFWRKGAY